LRSREPISIARAGREKPLPGKQADQNRKGLPMSSLVKTVVVTFCLLSASLAAAHHSAALFYNLDGRAEITGTVTEFRFANPHAILKVDVVGDDGEVQHWTAETTSPSILRRRGWSQASFKAGDEIRLEGLPSADGTYLLRITRAFRADGTEIGVPRGTDN
jgi:hypothetical protein